MLNLKNFFKNVGSGVEAVKEILQSPEIQKPTTNTQEIKNLLQGPQQPQPQSVTNFLRDNLSTMNIPDSYYSNKIELPKFDSFDTKYPGFKTFNPFDIKTDLLSKYQETSIKMNEERARTKQLVDEGILKQSDINIFTGELITPEEVQSAEETYGFINDITSATMRSIGIVGDVIANAPMDIATKLSGQDRIGKKISVVGDITRLADMISPGLGEASRSFFGVEKDSEDVNLKTAGEEIRPLANIIGIDIDKDSAMVPVLGVLSVGLDLTGGGSGKNTIRQMLKKVSKAEDLIPAIKALSKDKITDEEAIRFANQLFNNKKKSASFIDNIIDLENKSSSSINIDPKMSANEFKDHTNKKMAKDAIKEVDDIVVDVTKESSDLLEKGVINEKQFSDISKAKEADNLMSRIYDEFNYTKKIDDVPDKALEEAMAEFKRTYNFNRYADMPTATKKKFFDFIKESQETINLGKNDALRTHPYFKDVEAGLAEDFTKLDKDGINQTMKDLLGTAESATEEVKTAFKNNDTVAGLSNLRLESQLKNITSGGLSFWKLEKAKFASGLTELQQKVVDTVRFLQKKGLSDEAIDSSIKKITNGGGISDLENKMLDELVTNQSSMGEIALELINRYRYNNMLSNPQTHGQNFIWSAVENTVRRPIEEGIATGIDYLTGGKRVVGENTAYLKAIFNKQNVKDSISEAVNVIKGNKGFVNQDLGKAPITLTVGRIKRILGKSAKANKLNDFDLLTFFDPMIKFLNGADAGMRSLVRKGEEGRLLVRAGVDDISKLTPKNADKLRVEAIKNSEDAILRQTKIEDGDGFITSSSKYLAGLINNARAGAGGIGGRVIGGVASLEIPFVNTLSVLARKRLRRTPIIGLLDAITYNPNKTGLSKFVANDISKLIAEQVLSTAIVAGSYKFYKNMTEEEIDDKVKFDRGEAGKTSTSYSDNEGNSYNSIKNGEKWMNWSDFMPGGIEVLLGAKIASLNLNKENLDEMGELVSLVTTLGSEQFKSIFMSGFLQSGADAIQFYSGNSDDNAVTHAGKVLSQFSGAKSLLSKINQTYGDNRKVNSPEKIDELYDYVFKDFIDMGVLFKDGKLQFGSEKIPQKTDRDETPLFYGNPTEIGKTTGEKLANPQNALDIFNPGRPKYRDEDIHNKYLQEKTKEDIADRSKEGEELTKTENATLLSIVKKIDNGTGITKAEKAKLLNLSPDQSHSLERDYLNNSVDTASRYLDDAFTGRLTKKGKEYLMNMTPGESSEAQKKWETRNYAKAKNIVYSIATGKGITKKEKEWLLLIEKSSPKTLYKAQNYYNKTYGY